MKKKNKIRIYPLIVMGCIIILTISCKKDNNNNNSNASVPVVTTSAVINITTTSAACGGNVTSDGGAEVTARGVCWSTGQTPTTDNSKTTNGTGTGSFSSNMTGLSSGTTYYARAYATNSAGTGYGSAVSFSTQQIVTDFDGNVYHTVTIGTQVWMVEDLKVTHYRNGDPIPNETDGPTWIGLSTGAYCDYNNDPNNSTTYGRLYNWFAVTDSRYIAPAGWHIPSYTEWSTLIAYLGGSSTAGGKLKEAGTTHWQSPNAGATNETGFTALPTGYRDINGSFVFIYINGSLWSSTEYPSVNTYAWLCGLNYSVGDASMGYYSKNNGLAVRCIKD